MLNIHHCVGHTDVHKWWVLNKDGTEDMHGPGHPNTGEISSNNLSIVSSSIRTQTVIAQGKKTVCSQDD